MKKKYSSLASPIWSLINICPHLLLLFILSCFATSNVISVVLFGVVIAIVIFLCYHFSRSCFRRFTMEQKGIRNKYIMFRWEEINDISTCTRRIWMKTFAMAPYVCIGEQAYKGCGYYIDLYDPGWNDYNYLDPKKCIFFVLNKRNYIMLQKFSAGKSEALNKFLDDHKYIVELKRKDW